MIGAITIGFLEIKFVDILDVLLVTFMLVQVYKLMRGSIAIRVFLGFLLLYLIYLLVRALDMELIASILGEFMGVGVLAVIVLFQQEIRKFLLLLGRTTSINEGGGGIFGNAFSFWTGNGTVEAEISPIVEAFKSMGGSNTGALIVLSKNSELKFYAESGDRLDSLLSKRLLLAIFNKYSPLHDGAVIVYNNRIIAARCILPVTERDDIPANYGLRHRAAIGMSEATDVLVLIVSEETGQLATARNGRISQNLSAKDLRQKITDYLKEETKQNVSILDLAKAESVASEKEVT